MMMIMMMMMMMMMRRITTSFKSVDNNLMRHLNADCHNCDLDNDKIMRMIMVMMTTATKMATMTSMKTIKKGT